MNKNEKLFYDKLKDIFIGAKIEGNSGFINLMRIKSQYFDSVFKQLNNEIDEELKEFPDFREEMFDKLYTFFNAYFSESGSIYFTYTPLKSKIYDKIYTNQNDVILFWKTRMLYYVKSDKIWNNLKVGYNKDGVKYQIIFDVSSLEHKSGNEKKSIIYELKSMDANRITFNVSYSEKGRLTKVDDTLREFKKSDIYLNEEDLDKIFKIFEKQNEIDYFINKNAKEFLREQFDLWLKNYIFDDETDFTDKRLKELKILKDIAYKIIDFVSQFEDELVKIWNKPKFVLNSNYVITLDRIAKKDGIEIIERILKHDGLEEQIEEWKKLGIIDNFEKDKVFINTLTTKELSKEYQFLPIDTKYFKDIELDILGLFDNIDDELDGWLIHSENYQALNTILFKFKEKVQTIYIDPPFNLGTNADFFYNVNYKDSTWATMLENRISLARNILNDKGSIFVRCDYNGNMYVRLLMNEIFGEDTFCNEIVVGKTPGKKKTGMSFSYTKDYLIFHGKTLRPTLKELRKKTENYEFYIDILRILKKEKNISWDKVDKILKESLFWVDLDHRPGERKENRNRTLIGIEFEPPKGRHWIKSQKELDELYRKGKARIMCKNCGAIFYSKSDIKECCSSKKLVIQVFLDEDTVGDNWTDISGYSQTHDFQTENSEILLKRVIESTSNEGDIVVDFFLGSGTTTAVAHKLGRKWTGVEMGEHFYSVVLPRMKKVLAYDASGISKEKDAREKYSRERAGGFFKYYDLEQYEQILRRCHYIPSEPFFNLDDKSIYEQYIFLKDPKLLDSVELDYKNSKINIDFDYIYPNIDIAETLSLVKGKKIKKIGKDFLILKDDNGDEERIEYSNIDFKTIKPLIWW